MKSSKLLLLTTAVAGVLAGASAQAQNSSFAPGDLFLTIQNPGGAQNNTNIYVANLGATGSIFRDAAPGSFTSLGVNLASTLSNFGASWADLTTIYLGAAQFRGSSEFSNTLLTLDPQRTLYLTKARVGVGTIGQANSAGITVGTGSANGAVSNLTTVRDQFEALSGAVPIGSFTTSNSSVDDQNPFTIPGVQGAAWGVIGGGTQANFGSGSFGTLGAAGSIELALDLYRVQFRNDISGQYGFGAATQTGEYLGTITVNGAGDVGYLKADAVPEPSAIALLGLTALGFAARRRRPATTA